MVIGQWPALICNTGCLYWLPFILEKTHWNYKPQNQQRFSLGILKKMCKFFQEKQLKKLYMFIKPYTQSIVIQVYLLGDGLQSICMNLTWVKLKCNHIYVSVCKCVYMCIYMYVTCTHILTSVRTWIYIQRYKSACPSTNNFCHV